MSCVIGKDCHIILSHPEIDDGEGYGFLLAEDQGIKNGGVQITREVDSGGTTRLWLHFDVLLADRAVNPDGTDAECSHDVWIMQNCVNSFLKEEK